MPKRCNELLSAATSLHQRHAFPSAPVTTRENPRSSTPVTAGENVAPRHEQKHGKMHVYSIKWFPVLVS